MFLYALTVFLSAFLLFQVQPVIAKMILPWFGGSAMVWTSCMLFFQAMLLAGYTYAHFLVEKLSPQKRTRLHLTLLAISILSLPINPRDWLKPEGGSNPLVGILLVLGISVGLPYFLCSTTGPLVQAWYAASHPDRLPYRLFALSNLGSLIALLAYPVLIEPNIPTEAQGRIWSLLYFIFVLICGWLAWRTRNAAAGARESAEAELPAPPTAANKALWVLLAACPSVMLLAITNHLTANIAAIPFLWVVPLALYLLSFMLCFDSDRWYSRTVFPGLLAVALGAMAYTYWKDDADYSVRWSIAGFCLALFIICMFCHGELALRRPHPRYLTTFYLMLSLGGACGGLTVSLIAPLLFDNFYELTVGMALTGIAASIALWQWNRIADVVWIALAVFLCATIYRDVRELQADTRLRARNFYGALRVKDSGSESDQSRLRNLVHGTINHGAQYLDVHRRRIATTYYGERSGAGLAITEMRRPGMRIGVIGLGTGTLSSYGRPGDHVVIYEINPLVKDIANNMFFFLRECPARLDVVMGDARLSLERQRPQNFDVLAVDAFSSDAIPVHLLTREAVELFFKHIRPGGILALHVSNKFLALQPVVRRIASDLKIDCIQVEGRENGALEQYSSDWMLLSKDTTLFDRPVFKAATAAETPVPAPLWTDNYSNLYQILR